LKSDLQNARKVAGAAAALGAICGTLTVALSGANGAAGPNQAPIQTAAAQLDLSPLSLLRFATAIVGAIALAVSAYWLNSKASKQQITNWTRARSASEGLKEQIYRFLVGGPPYATSADPPGDFLKNRTKLENAVRDLNQYKVAVPQAVADRTANKRPLALDPESYITRRVVDQIEGYYRPNAAKNARKSAQFRGAVFYLGLVAAVLGVLAGGGTLLAVPVISGLGPWIAVITTLAGGLTAYVAAERYDYQTLSYSGTANRLQELRDTWRFYTPQQKHEHLAEFVDHVEAAISSENEAWLAEWERDETQGQQGATQ
jgi:hypothetical protein